MTFRIDPHLAQALRQVANQTLFVETALLAALGETCPLCDGRGKVQSARLTVSDFKQQALPRLTRSTAPRLREIVKLGRRLMATDLKLAPTHKRGELAFQLMRQDEALLMGVITGRAAASPFVSN